jgi:hypothetical protein
MGIAALAPHHGLELARMQIPSAELTRDGAVVRMRRLFRAATSPRWTPRKGCQELGAVPTAICD